MIRILGLKPDYCLALHDDASLGAGISVSARRFKR